MAQNAISDKLKFNFFLGGMLPDPLAWAAFNTDLISEIIEIQFCSQNFPRVGHKILPYHFQYYSYALDIDAETRM